MEDPLSKPLILLHFKKPMKTRGSTTLPLLVFKTPHCNWKMSFQPTHPHGDQENMSYLPNLGSWVRQIPFHTGRKEYKQSLGLRVCEPFMAGNCSLVFHYKINLGFNVYTLLTYPLFHKSVSQSLPLFSPPLLPLHPFFPPSLFSSPSLNLKVRKESLISAPYKFS